MTSSNTANNQTPKIKTLVSEENNVYLGDSTLYDSSELISIRFNF